MQFASAEEAQAFQSLVNMLAIPALVLLAVLVEVVGRLVTLIQKWWR